MSHESMMHAVRCAARGEYVLVWCLTQESLDADFDTAVSLCEAFAIAATWFKPVIRFDGGGCIGFKVVEGELSGRNADVLVWDESDGEVDISEVCEPVQRC